MNYQLLALVATCATTAFGCVWYLASRLTELSTALHGIREDIGHIREAVIRNDERTRGDISGLTERVARIEVKIHQ